MGFPLWVIGVLLSAFASLSGTLGLTFQKIAHTKQAAKVADLERQRSKDPAADDDNVSELDGRNDGFEGESDDDLNIPQQPPEHKRHLSALAEEDDDEDEDAEQSFDGLNQFNQPSSPQDVVVQVGSSGKDMNTTGAAGKKQKEKEEEDDDDGDEEDGSFVQQPLWVLGMALVIIGAILDFASYGFAPQSLLAPMATLTLVFNTILAPKLLGESLSHRDIMATFIIVGGTGVVVAFSPHETPEYDVHSLRDLYIRYEVFVYACVIGGSILFFSSLAAGFDRRPPTSGFWLTSYKFLYPALAGIVGGQSVLFAKAAVELLKTTVGSENQFVFPEPYVCILLLFMCLWFQVKFLNAGLARFDALVVIPVYQVFWMISGILGGAVVFDEFSTFDSLQWVMFPLGTVIAVAGMYLLTQRDSLKIIDKVVGDNEGAGLGKNDTRDLLALSTHRTSVFFGGRNSVLVAMGNQHKDVLQFAMPRSFRRNVKQFEDRRSKFFGRHENAARLFQTADDTFINQSSKALQERQQRPSLPRRHTEMAPSKVKAFTESSPL